MNKADVQSVRLYVNNSKEFQKFFSKYEEKITPKKERFDLFVALVKSMPLVDNPSDAKDATDTILNVVEDFFSGASFNPESHMTDGRMYPADGKFRLRDEHGGIQVYRHRSHVSKYYPNGAVSISKSGENTILLQVVGADGKPPS